MFRLADNKYVWLGACYCKSLLVNSMLFREISNVGGLNSTVTLAKPFRLGV